MSKKTIVILSLLSVAILIVALVLTSEIMGVPRKQLDADLRDSEGPGVRNQAYKHDVDLSLHTDNITVKYEVEYMYMTVYYTDEYEYSYNKSMDKWELEEKHTEEIRYELKENISSAIFRGKDEFFNNKLQYNIEVTSVDYKNSEVSVYYTIETNSKVYTGSAILGLGEGGANKYVVHSYGGTEIAISFWPKNGISAGYS